MLYTETAGQVGDLFYFAFDKPETCPTIMLSYAKGPDAPLLETTIAQAFRATCGRFPDREALVVRHQKVRYTFAQLEAEVERTARGLAGLGLGARDRVGVGPPTV